MRNMRQKYPEIELYILWSELTQRKLSPTLANAHYSCPDEAIGLVGIGSWAEIFLLLPMFMLIKCYTHNHLTASFPEQPGWAGTRKVKPIWILLEQ